MMIASHRLRNPSQRRRCCAFAWTSLWMSAWMLRGFVALGLAVGVGPAGSLVAPALARPLRQPVVSTLLHDLTQIEAHNADRDDQRTGQLIEQQIAGTRAALLRVLAGTQPIEPTLRATLDSLYLMATYNRRSTDTDADILVRMGGSIEHMRLRTELALQKGWRTGTPLPKAPPDYQPPLSYQPPGYEPLPYGRPDRPPLPPPPPPPPLTSPLPMRNTAFADLLTRMQRLSFGDEKIGLARDAVSSGNFFTCEQVSQLMKTSAFADEQVKIAAALYPRVVDPQNFVQLTSTLTFDSDRDKLRQLVGR
jgi:hypothetical protein